MKKTQIRIAAVAMAIALAFSLSAPAPADAKGKGTPKDSAGTVIDAGSSTLRNVTWE